MAGVKKAKKNNLTFCPRQGQRLVFRLESVENYHGRNFRFSWQWELSAVSG